MISGYLYAAIWFILAAYLFYTAIREDRFFFVLSGFFVFLGAWATANELIKTDLMAGAYGWIYRGAAVIVLILCAVKYYRYKKNRDE